MDLASSILILVSYYLRPQEWLLIFQLLRFIYVTSALGILGTFQREKGFRFANLVRTPHDWLMVVYFGWIVFTAPIMKDAWDLIKIWIIFYFIINQALHSPERFRKYMMWWLVIGYSISILGLLAQVGVDPLGSKYKSDIGGRWVLNNSSFENANAFGHGIAPTLVMIYFYFIWKRPVFMKEVGLLLLIIPGICLYFTQSKGAFLAAFGCLTLGQCFGRPKYVQITVLLLALTAGWGGVKLLPRMQELDNPRREAGIGGRLHTFEFGLKTMNDNPTGCGWMRYIFKHAEKYGYVFASHSAYVEIGAELGRKGLFLFLGLIYCCFRTLVTAKTQTDDMERVRRMLFVLIASFTISAWMLDLGHGFYFFMIVSTISAFHRLLQEEHEAGAIPIEAQPTLIPQLTAGTPASVPGLAMPTLMPMPKTAMGMNLPTSSIPTADRASNDASPPKRKFWRRLGWIDFVLIWGITELWVYIWEYIIKNM